MIFIVYIFNTIACIFCFLLRITIKLLTIKSKILIDSEVEGEKFKHKRIMVHNNKIWYITIASVSIFVSSGKT